jgi:hypothetical protein
LKINRNSTLIADFERTRIWAVHAADKDRGIRTGGTTLQDMENSLKCVIAVQESITIPNNEEFGYNTGDSDFEGTYKATHFYNRTRTL